jgi:hypothetical protein
MPGSRQRAENPEKFPLKKYFFCRFAGFLLINACTKKIAKQ